MQHQHACLLMSGPCVLAATLANQAFDFGNILNDKMEIVLSVNKTHNSDTIATISRVVDVQSIGEGINIKYDCNNYTNEIEFERVTTRFIGVRNIVPDHLAELHLPDVLFEAHARPRQIENVIHIFKY
jgi:hypothetical protein